MNATEQAAIMAQQYADVVLLQEVGEGCYRSNYLAETSFYALNNGYHQYPYYAFFLQAYNAGGCGSFTGKYGDAILSRFSITSTATLDLPHAFYGHGGLGRATFTLPPFEFAAYTLHPMGLSIGNTEAIDQHNFICQQIGSYGLTPQKFAIWGGDFNTDLPWLDYFYGSMQCSNFPRLNLVQADHGIFDHVFGSYPSGMTPFVWRYGATVPNSYGASDHAALIGAFRINGTL